MPLPNNLSDEFGEELASKFYRPLPIENHGRLQKQIRTGSDVRLRLSLKGAESKYMTIPVDKQGNKLISDSVPVLADGKYTYVIKENYPSILFCALNDKVEGHTSLTFGSKVLYAGELNIVNGRMISWSNDSGHYEPPEERKLRNIHPELRDVLPVRLFTEYG